MAKYDTATYYDYCVCELTTTIVFSMTETIKILKSRDMFRILILDMSSQAADEQPSQVECMTTWWRKHSAWLQEQGYTLRPYWRAGWTPPQPSSEYWKSSDRNERTYFVSLRTPFTPPLHFFWHLALTVFVARKALCGRHSLVG